MNHRVVVTGLGVVSPNGAGIPDFFTFHPKWCFRNKVYAGV